MQKDLHFVNKNINEVKNYSIRSPVKYDQSILSRRSDSIIVNSKKSDKSSSQSPKNKKLDSRLLQKHEITIK